LDAGPVQQEGMQYEFDIRYTLPSDGKEEDSFRVCKADLWRNGKMPKLREHIWDPREFLLHANNYLDMVRYIMEEKKLIIELLDSILSRLS
ncbi:MAG: hypothetical protein ACRDF4_05800, partial [Rhabdochlamydiaceae bacterium]